MTDAERVVFLLQPAGAAYLTTLIQDQAERDQLVTSALSEYPDARLAAAFVLEMLCNAARVVATAESGQTKSFTIGPIKIEKVVNLDSVDGARANAFCAQATLLRREVRRSRGLVLATPTFIRDSRLAALNDELEDWGLS